MVACQTFSREAAPDRSTMSQRAASPHPSPARPSTYRHPAPAAGNPNGGLVGAGRRGASRQRGERRPAHRAALGCPYRRYTERQGWL